MRPEYTSDPWYDRLSKVRDHSWVKDHSWGLSSEAQAVVYQTKLVTMLETHTHVQFNHVRTAHLGRRIAVFVVKGDQSAVLYDKTKGFPSARLMASLVLLGSP